MRVAHFFGYFNQFLHMAPLKVIKCCLAFPHT